VPNLWWARFQLRSSARRAYYRWLQRRSLRGELTMSMTDSAPGAARHCAAWPSKTWGFLRASCSIGLCCRVPPGRRPGAREPSSMAWPQAGSAAACAVASTWAVRQLGCPSRVRNCRAAMTQLQAKFRPNQTLTASACATLRQPTSPFSTRFADMFTDKASLAKRRAHAA